MTSDMAGQGQAGLGPARLGAAWQGPDAETEQDREDRRRALGMWSQGYVDVQIAKALGTTEDRVMELIFGRGRT